MALPSTDRFGRTITVLSATRFRITDSANQSFEVQFPDGVSDARMLSAIESFLPLAEAATRQAAALVLEGDKQTLRDNAAAAITTLNQIDNNRATLTAAQQRDAIGELAAIVRRLIKYVMAQNA